MYTLNPRHNVSITRKQLDECISYREALNDHRLGLGKHPGVEPQTYQLYLAMMIAGPNTPGRSPTTNPGRTCFAASEGGNIINLAAQALQALMETQDELRNVLRSAGQTGNAGSNRQAILEANIPHIPDRFTGQITTTLASCISTDDQVLVEITQQVNGLYLQECRLLQSKSLGPGLREELRSKWFAPYSRGKLSKGGKGKGRGGKGFPSTATLPAPLIVVGSGTRTRPSPIEIDKPRASPPLGTTSLDAGSSTHGAQTDADPSLESDKDGWKIPHYDEESW
ncbi:hypothetical protein FRC09_002673 [Ceratobasidium sp. 395]|nr:hypothetical protein FRC09_002673 [Ceratobasidium sp. 395]